ncbi:hypothetical protein HWV62_5654 [Athelia sp. TMB]|nr:hypothetical protein HWV62_5654 [Athelia sp. TMB]
MAQPQELEKSPSRSIAFAQGADADGEAAKAIEKTEEHTPQPSMLRAIISNSTMVSIALPVIGRDLNIPEQRLQWLVSAYSLSSGCFLVFFGRIADLYGRKRVFIAGSLVLAAFSLGLGFSNGTPPSFYLNEITLDVLRGFQGIGAAATIPSSVGILAHAFPPSRIRSFAFATFSAGAPVGAAIGMTLGGVLTQLTAQTWRSVFYLAAGLSFFVLILGVFSIEADLPSTEVDKRVDWIGAGLVTTGLVLIVFVLSDGEIVGWKTSYIIALLIIGVLAMVLFVAWEHYLESVHTRTPEKAAAGLWTPPPLMKLSIWGRAKGRFAVAMLVAFLNWSSFLSWVFWVQLYYQDYLMLSPILTMVRLLPMFVTGVLCNFAIALCIGRLSLVYIVAIGTVLTGTASLLFALIDPASPYWAFGFPAAVVSVFGADFVFASGTIFVAKIALPHEQSLAGALFNTMTQGTTADAAQIGTAFGLTVSTIVFNRVSDRYVPALGPHAATLKGYRAAQWTAFGFAMISAVMAAIFLRGVGIVGHSKKSVAQDEKRALEKEERERRSSVDAPTIVN